MKSRAAIAFKAAAIAALIVALWNPVVPWKTLVVPMVLLDQSASMQSTNNVTWPQVSAYLQKLTGAHEAQLIRFAGQPRATVRIKMGDPLPPPPRGLEGTDIEAALQFALARTVEGQPIFLYSDGIETIGDATPLLQRARRTGHGVFVLAPGEHGQHANARLVNVQLPGVVGVDTRFTAIARVFSSTNQKATLDVTSDGQVIASRQVALQAGTTTTHTMDLSATRPGPLTLEIRLRAPNDPSGLDNRLTRIVDVAGRATVLYVSAARKTALEATLAAGGWRVMRASPSRLAQDIPERVDVVVLDNVAANDAPDVAWRRLAHTVASRGTGLIVLGGDNSFGSGNYRGSVLEDLLPVTAQSGHPVEPISVVFLLDRSGSMDKPVGRGSRFNYAKQAILKTAAELDHDEVGVTVFDTTARVLLPLGRYRDPARAIAAAWEESGAAGGTILKSGVRSAINQLRHAANHKRVLIVVTDGFSADHNLDTSLRDISRLGIDVVALAVGTNADATLLKRMTALNAGAFLTINDVAQIPAIMGNALGARRLAVEAGNIRPVEVQALPFSESWRAWPPLSGYMVTRARLHAIVFLASPQHDPLLASWQYGLGTVLALPAGLGAFASNWHSWAGWRAFAGGVVEWAAGANDGATARISINRAGRDIRLLVDAIDRTGDWTTNGPPALHALLSSARLGISKTFDIPRTAPGRYRLPLAVGTGGAYRLGVRVGSRQLLRDFYYSASSEWGSRKSSLNGWLKAGLIRPSSEFRPQPAARARKPFAALALLLYSLSLANLIPQRRNQ